MSTTPFTEPAATPTQPSRNQAPRHTPFGEWWTRRMRERRDDGHSALEAAILVQAEWTAPDWKGPRP